MCDQIVRLVSVWATFESRKRPPFGPIFSDTVTLGLVANGRLNATRVAQIWQLLGHFAKIRRLLL